MARPLINVPVKVKRGETFEIKTLISHAMEPGYRFTTTGARLPRDIVTSFSCSYNSVEVFRAEMGAGIAANPYLRFFVRAERSGDIECRWVDQENATGYASARVTVNG